MARWCYVRLAEVGAEFLFQIGPSKLKGQRSPN